MGGGPLRRRSSGGWWQLSFKRGRGVRWTPPPGGSHLLGAVLGLRADGGVTGPAGAGPRLEWAGPGGRGRARRSRLSLPAAGGRDRARRRRRLRREQHGLGHRAVGESDRPGSKFLPFWSPDPLPLCFCKTLAGAWRFPLQRPLASPLFAFSRSFPGRFRTPRAKGDLAGADQGN